MQPVQSVTELDESAVAEADGNSFPSITRPELRRTKTVAGVVLTVLYIGAFVAYVIAQRRAFIEMSSADFGTFLSGVFAPLAFLWLVLGFFQQGDELRHSADALWLQGEELRNSVEQQRQLVAAQRDQLAFDRERLEAERQEIQRQSRPEFVFVSRGYSTSGNITNVHLVVLNRGRACTDFRMEVEGQPMRQPLFQGGTEISLSIQTTENVELGLHTYTASFVDALGNPGTQELRLIGQDVGDRIILQPVD